MAMKIQAALPLTDLDVHFEALGAPEQEERQQHRRREGVDRRRRGHPVKLPLARGPLSFLALIDAVEEAYLPPGVLNVVTDRGAELGEALVRHPEVGAVSFTGSVATGSRVAALAAESVKRVTLELGDRSANVVLDDADLATAVKVGVVNAFVDGGQTCTAWTHMLVPQDRHDGAVELVWAAAETFTRETGVAAVDEFTVESIQV